MPHRIASVVSGEAPDRRPHRPMYPDAHATEDLIRLAAEAVRQASAVVITAGAGMGSDSGLPDFRGDRGFWKAYPHYARLGLSFVGLANPEHFDRDPPLGWGFYGHRTQLYREAQPHDGFRILRRWTAAAGRPAFVVTSNVDGHFQKAGFPEAEVLEIHGSIHHLQCTTPCTGEIWASEAPVPVDLATMRAQCIPRCPRCGSVARPNILMFGDAAWLEERTEAQRERFEAFLDGAGDGRLAVIELGAGTAIPSIRDFSEYLGRRRGATVVRINPREPQIQPPHVGLGLGALAALSAIDRVLGPR